MLLHRKLLFGCVRVVSMASAQVDLSEGCVGLTRDQFRRLTKEQLISLAGVEDIELAKDIRKPAIVAYLTRELNL